MAEKYDIFISYRRFEDEERKIENISKAGRLSSEFSRKGYKVFFDQNVITAKYLKEKILPAVRNSRYFVLLLTENCLKRCKDDGDWVRQEIEEAHTAGSVIVPITLDNTVEQWPGDLPESLAFLVRDGGIDITNIHNDKSYQSDIDGLLSAVIRFPQQRQEGAGIPNDNRRPKLKVLSNLDCFMHIDNKKVKIKADELKMCFLPEGEYLLKFESVVNAVDSITIKFNMPNKDKVYNVDLLALKQEREKKEREARGEFDVKGVQFKMVYVEGGTFMMGATVEQGSEAYDREKPAHQVTLSDYYIGETVVTQELWMAVMGYNSSYWQGDNLPVEQVSWDDAQAFIKKLNSIIGCTFRLPTEAEWEYAARGGKKSKGYKYSGSNDIDEVAWYGDIGDKTHPVKEKKANELGLYDLSGNVWEWCQNWYGGYGEESQKNPQGPSSGSDRVGRGGSWRNVARSCRVSYRTSNIPSFYINRLGFRLALTP